MSRWTDTDRAEARKAAEALLAAGDHKRNPAAPHLVGWTEASARPGGHRDTSRAWDERTPRAAERLAAAMRVAERRQSYAPGASKSRVRYYDPAHLPEGRLDGESGYPRPAPPTSSRMSREMEATLAKLPERQREAVRLVVGLGLAQEEAAEMLGVSQQTVSRDVRAGLEGLRALLECPHLYDDLGCVWCEGPLEVAA